MVRGTPRLLVDALNTAENMLRATRISRQNFLKQLKADVIHANKQYPAEARYKRQFDARLRHTKNVVLHGVVIFVEATLDDQLQKLALVGSGLFSVEAFDAHTVIIQRPDKSVEKISRQQDAKKSQDYEHKVPAIPFVLDDDSRVLNSSTCHHPYTIAPHASALKKGNKGSAAANFDTSATLLHRVEHCRGSDRRKFLKTLKFPYFWIVDGPKYSSVRPKYRSRWYGYNPKADTWEPITQISRSHILAYCKQKKN